MIRKGFRHRVCPPPAQAFPVARREGVLRSLRNPALEWRRLPFRRRVLGGVHQISELTGLRTELPWRAATVCAPLLMEFDRAWPRWS